MSADLDLSRRAAALAAEVERLQTGNDLLREQLDTVRAAVDKILVTHAWSCASYTYLSRTPTKKRKCDCIAQDTLAARRAVGLEE